ncbi:MAG TPA: hypothetical protein VKU01_33760 [Bryobacteraceae bacterium]|nr:hypothetical protein [Bryobacteraceae bacterium]
MEFFEKPASHPRRLGILAGSFNPPTVAHLELADAAQGHVDQVLWVLPREFPHKRYHGATLTQRVDMLRKLGLTAAVSSGGLFLEIARECREHYGPQTKLSFLCGRDAAERIVNWDYGRPGVAEEMLREFELLVAARLGEYSPPSHLQRQIRRLHLRNDFDHVSSTEVRERIRHSHTWEHLVPEPIVEDVRKIYS